MLCVAGKNDALEDDPLWNMQPVKSVPHESTQMVKVLTALDELYILH